MDNVSDALMNMSFATVRAFWPGLPRGCPESTFEEMFEIFFLPSNYPCNPQSVWLTMWKFGYIKLYHNRLRNTSPENQINVQTGFKKLLDTVQCLPHASRHTERSLGHLWTSNKEKNRVEVLTNPKLYKIRELTVHKETGSSKCVHITVSRSAIEARIKAYNEGTTVKEVLLKKRQIKRNERRSANAKNRQKPPPNRYMQKKANSPAYDTEDDTDLEFTESLDKTEPTSSDSGSTSL